MIVVVVEFLEHPTFLPDPKYRCELKKKLYICVSVKAGKKVHGKKKERTDHVHNAITAMRHELV